MLEPLRQATRHSFGAFNAGVARGVRLRHDHGSQFVSFDFPHELDVLGLESSPAFVREPEGQGCAERFIRVSNTRPGAGRPDRPTDGGLMQAPCLETVDRYPCIRSLAPARTQIRVRESASGLRTGLMEPSRPRW